MLRDWGTARQLGTAVVVVLVAASVALAGVGAVTAAGAQSTNTTTEASATASADASAAARTTSSTSVQPGGTVTVTLEATGNGSSASLEEAFTPDLASATIESVTVGGSSASTIIEAADPTGALVTLSSASAGASIVVEYSVTIPSNATPGSVYTIDARLTGTQESSVEPTNITVRENRPPAADAGTNLSVKSGTSVTLDASGSTDPDGDTLGYAWTQISGSSVALSNTSVKQPTVTAPDVNSPQTLAFEVNVSDGNGGFDTDTTYVTVSPPTQGGPERSAPSSVTPGGSATVTLQANATDSTVTFNEVFSPTVDSSSIDSVTVDGNSVSPLVNAADTEGVVVTVDGVSSGATVEVDYTLSVSDNAAVGDVYTIDGNVTSGTSTELGTSQITVEERDPAVAQYDTDGDGVEISELGIAAGDYALGKLSIVELGKIAAAYASGG